MTFTMFTMEQMMYVATKVNKAGGKGERIVTILPPVLATDGPFDFKLVYETPQQSAGDRDWRD